MKITFITIFFICVNCLAFAQVNYKVNGSVADTASNSKLSNATISILNAKDSTLVKFTRVSPAGTFEINNLIPAKLILLATYPGYARLCRKL